MEQNVGNQGDAGTLAPVQRAHGFMGKAFVRRPFCTWLTSFLAFGLLQLGWIPEVRELFDIELGKGIFKALSTKDFEELWSTDSGDVPVEEGVRKWKTLRDRRWEQSLQVTMFVGKGPLKDQDLLTPEVFKESAPLLKKFHSLSVVVKNKTYTTWDLCARGAVPDKPRNEAVCKLWKSNHSTLMAGLQDPKKAMVMGCLGSGDVEHLGLPGLEEIPGLPYMPCQISAPQACFSEYADDALHPTYKFIDPIIDNATLFPQLAPQLPMPFATRPSYVKEGAEGMKRVVSTVRSRGQRGCHAWTKHVTFTPGLWGGGVHPRVKENKAVEKVPAIMWSLFIDAPARAGFRMKLASPEKAVEADVAEAVRLFEGAWQREVEAFSKSSSTLEVVNMQWPSTFEEIADQYEDAPIGMIVLGYALMTAFIFVSLVSFQKPLRSRWIVGVMGLVAVAGAAGGAGSLFLLAGHKLNALMLIILPFFALGSGVNDMFVFVRHFSELTTKPPASDQEVSIEDIVCQTLVYAGPGAFVTSCCNFAILICGAATFTVPALADFCACAAIVAALNYITIVTQVVPLLVFAGRQARSPGCGTLDQAEVACTVKFPSPVSWLEKTSVRSRIAASLFVALCALAFLVTSAVFIADREVGYNPSEVVKDDSPQRRPVEVFFEKFNSFPAFLCFEGVDVPQHQREMLQLFHRVTSQTHAEEGFATNYLTTFYSVLHLMATQAPPQMPGCPAPAAPAGTAPMQFLDGRSMPYAPHGTVTAGYPFYSLYHAWSKVPLEAPQTVLDPCNPAAQSYVIADLAFTNEFTYANSNRSSMPPLRYSFFPFTIVDLYDNEDFVRSIEQVNSQLNTISSLRGKVSVYGPTFTFWSVLIDLEKEAGSMTAVTLTTLFVCTLFCSWASSSRLASNLNAQDFRGAAFEVFTCVSLAAISTLACAMIVMGIYGFSLVLLDLKYNQFVAMALLAAAGMSVEFVAHLVAAFLRETGPAQDRVLRAWATVSPAVLQGSLSTMVGLLPMALSPFVFVVKYCFGMFAMVQIVGLVIGMLFLPAFLSIGGMVCSSDAKKDEGQSSTSSPQEMPNVLTSTPGAESQKQKELIDAAEV